MLGSRPSARVTGVRSRTRRPEFDHLEAKVVLSQAHGLQPWAIAPRFGANTISGRVSDTATGHGLGRVAVQLINENGQVERTSLTGHAGRYLLPVRRPGGYVVHAVTPRRAVQTFPTFTFEEPTGSYAPGFGADSWNYRTGNTDPANGPVGPLAWSTIAPAGNLPFQSPIDLSGPTTDLGQFLSIHYNETTPTRIVNNGDQIQVQFANSGATTIELNGEEFALSQFHYHDPSENVVNGQAYTMEGHFVNTSADGAVTVVAVFLQLGPHNDALDPILNAATASLSTPGSSTTIAQPINFAGLLPASMQGWFYQGSFTTPPLSQPVNWLVFSTPITLDAQQLAQYEQVADGSEFLPNARAIQPLDGRRLNEFNYDVNVQDQPVAGLDFGLTRYPRPLSPFHPFVTHASARSLA